MEGTKREADVNKGPGSIGYGATSPRATRGLNMGMEVQTLSLPGYIYVYLNFYIISRDNYISTNILN